MHAAYDALPERLKTRIAPLKVEFGYGGRARIGNSGRSRGSEGAADGLRDGSRAPGDRAQIALCQPDTCHPRRRHARSRGRRAARRALLVDAAAQRRAPPQMASRRHRHMGQSLHGAFGRRRPSVKRAARTLANDGDAVGAGPRRLVADLGEDSMIDALQDALETKVAPIVRGIGLRVMSASEGEVALSMPVSPTGARASRTRPAGGRALRQALSGYLRDPFGKRCVHCIAAERAS